MVLWWAAVSPKTRSVAAGQTGEGAEHREQNSQCGKVANFLYLSASLRLLCSGTRRLWRMTAQIHQKMSGHRRTQWGMCHWSGTSTRSTLDTTGACPLLKTAAH